VEGSEEVVAVAAVAAVVEVVAVPLEVLPDARQVVRQVAPDPEVLLLPPVRVRQVVLFYPVMGLLGRRQLSRSLGSLDQTGYLLNPIILVRVRVPVF
jgi:hypothetical protein